MPIATTQRAVVETLHLQAKVPASGLAEFILWMKQDGGIELQRDRILASFAAGAYRSTVETIDGPVVIEVTGTHREPVRQADPDRVRLSRPVEHADASQRTLIIRDLGETDIISVQMSAPDAPVVSICENEESIMLCLDFNADQFGEEEALGFVGEFAARLQDPLRQLL